MQNKNWRDLIFDRFSSLFADDFAVRIADPGDAAKVRAEQFDVIRANISTVMIGNIFAGFLSVMIFVGSDQFFSAISWYLGYLIFISFSMAPTVKKRKSNKRYKSAGNDRMQIKLASILGLAWVVLPIAVFGGADLAQRLFVIAATLALIGVGAFFLSGVPRAAVAYSTIMMVGLEAAIIINWHPAMLYSAVLVIAFTLLIIGMVKENTKFLIDRMEVRIALVESNNMISVLLREHEDSGYEWLWETGSDGEICNASKKFTQVAGRSAIELNGKKITSMVHDLPNPLPSWEESGRCNLGDAFRDNLPFRDIIVCYQHPNGAPRWWKLSGRPIKNQDSNSGGYRGVALDITDAKISEDKIAYLALYDSLTNLPNRASFKEKIESSIANTLAGKSNIALFVLDLDKFKHINDTLGHPAGDELLILVARRLARNCKDAVIVARLGGDEFSVLFDNVSSSETAEFYAAQLISCFKEPFVIAGRKMGINCSVGVAIAPMHGNNAADLIKNADLALYRAKSDNSSSFNIFEAEMDLQVRERRRLGQELQNAIVNNELYLLYQPLLSTATNKIIGYEALVRWQNPRCGTVNPEYFIPIAEENGMIVDIGKWVIRQACAEAASWNNTRRVSVNLSPLQFVGIQLESVVAMALGDSGLRPSRLELEITENSLMVNKDATLRTLQNLRQLGISIALDDFGTGYSSLSYLMSYPFDKIKIDRSFLSDDDKFGNNATIIKTIIGLAKSLNMRTTAEGVETIEHLEFLRSEGCDEIQGFLISQPVLPSAIEKGEDIKYFEDNVVVKLAAG